jgi:hypothetical protein
MGILLLVHVGLSLAGLFAGFVVMGGMFAANRLPGWTALFLLTTVLTNATGFFLPAPHFLPSHAIAILSLVVLAVAIYALYARHLAGGWRTAYVATAALGLYLNAFVLVVQCFTHIPGLKALAPTQTEPPFAISQVLLLIGFVLLPSARRGGFARLEARVANQPQPWPAAFCSSSMLTSRTCEAMDQLWPQGSSTLP